MAYVQVDYVLDLGNEVPSNTENPNNSSYANNNNENSENSSTTTSTTTTVHDGKSICTPANSTVVPDQVPPSKMVELEVIPSTTHALYGITNDVVFVVKVKTGSTTPNSKRSPLNLAIILDKSSSMHSGNKFVNAKLAIIQILRHLEPTDIVHLVAYDSEVTTVFKNGNVREIEILSSHVEGIKTSRNTNLWGGLSRGIEVLVQSKTPGYTDRIFLFSDGLVNCGEKNKKTILDNVAKTYNEYGIQISAFGLGDDFDQVLMRGIAEKGVGTYFFIDNSATIPKFVEFALLSLMSNVGTKATVKVNGISCGVVKKFFGDYDLTKGAILGDLSSNNIRKVLFRAEISPQTSDPETPVIECELTYTQTIDGVQKNFSEKNSVTLHFTTDSEEVKKGKNKEVAVQIALYKVSKIDSKLSRLIKKSPNVAMEYLTKEISILQSVLEIDNREFNGTNGIAHLLRQSKKNLENIQKKGGATKKDLKEIDHRGYVAGRGDAGYSASYMITEDDL